MSMISFLAGMAVCAATSSDAAVCDFCENNVYDGGDAFEGARSTMYATWIPEAGDTAERFQRRSERQNGTDLVIAEMYRQYDAQIQSTWRGVPAQKGAYEFVIYSQIVQEQKPRTIIEIGCFMGGSTMWLADTAKTQLGDYFVGTVCTDITLDNLDEKALSHPYVTVYQKDNRNLDELFTPEFMAKHPKPWLVVEDAHFFHEQAMASIHRVLTPGDYVVVEDVNDEWMHVWEDRWDDPEEIEAMWKKTHDFKAFALAHEDLYRVDSKYQDFFGYNAAKSASSILRRIA